MNKNGKNYGTKLTTRRLLVSRESAIRIKKFDRERESQETSQTYFHFLVGKKTRETERDQGERGTRQIFLDSKKATIVPTARRTRTYCAAKREDRKRERDEREKEVREKDNGERLMSQIKSEFSGGATTRRTRIYGAAKREDRKREREEREKEARETKGSGVVPATDEKN
eukprot:scaffold11776_cov48-Attheya_sp.AAC.1